MSLPIVLALVFAVFAMGSWIAFSPVRTFQYDPHSPLPRMHVGRWRLQVRPQPFGHHLATAKRIIRWIPVLFVAIGMNLLRLGKLSIRRIERMFPANATRLLERAEPGVTRGDVFLGTRILNSFHPCLLSRTTDGIGSHRLAYNWDAYEQDGFHQLSNMDARFDVVDGQLMPVQITVQLRRRGSCAPNSPLEDPVTATAAQGGEAWLHAKRALRSVVGFAGEADVHISRIHLNVEQYSMAAYRNIDRNPVGKLLFPHVRDISTINFLGRRVIFGAKGFMVTNSAMTATGLMDHLQDELATLDWTGWRPREAICEGHRFAHVANLFWDALEEYVDLFFAEHHDEIAAHWHEVRGFSDDVVTHSLPYKMAKQDHLSRWEDTNERDKADRPRPETNGVVHAVRPFAYNDEPTDEEMENLKQVCRYVIYHATFFHTWVNDSQYADVGDLAYAQMAYRGLGSEQDPSLAPTPMQALAQLFLTLMITKHRYGFIMKNEDNDIPAEFLECLAKKRQEFADLEIDINQIRSRTSV